MRRTSMGLVAFGLFACNAILGNEDHYVLVSGGGAAGVAGTAHAGTGAKAGSSSEAGEGGVAGVGEEAGSSGASEADSGESSTGGTPGHAGSGAAGAGPCVATGAEDCFNGKDDDCNGAADCADSACTASSTCVPDASGAELGTLLPLMGSTCPTGYTAVTLHRGMTVDPSCTGCTCGTGTGYCTTSIGGHGSAPCPGFQIMGLTYNMFTTSCQPINPGTSTHHYSVLTFTDCTGTASGTAKPSAVQWSETRTFCKADRVGGGCKSGSVCLPKAPSGTCARKTGTATCGGAYPMSTGAVWNGGVNDTRTCGACECAGGYGPCNNASVQVYSDASCSLNPVTLSGANGAEGDDCALPYPPASGRVTGTPVIKQCVANVSPGGAIEEADPSTVCCQ